MSFCVLLATSLKSSVAKTPLPKLNTTANTRTLQTFGDNRSLRENNNNNINNLTPLVALALNQPVSKVCAGRWLYSSLIFSALISFLYNYSVHDLTTLD